MTASATPAAARLALTLPANPTPFQLVWFQLCVQTATALYGPPDRIRALPAKDYR